ncbi:TetR/AcrR family transcriptional regulator [Thermophagus xiamenensis]|uniref:Transcriptional regulator, TetR family n=1 Tax=Thermophagus xiamenensis TaxID=385682 RepID=A0A1I1UPL5_9BACT|nr:TetR/AcrR family transcriptional regulator [Thermophagus xiamenensis]SFD72717.1 transcriptional regulator, TetR family [Thermophagus xiamenensis]
MKNRIIKKAQEQFLQFGYSRVRVSDIATELAISKKTVYNHFKGKEELLYSVIENFQDEIESQLEELEQEQRTDYRDEVFAELEVVGNWVNKLSLLLHDLKRTFPKAYEQLWKAEREIIVERTMKKLEKGVSLGLLHADQRTQIAMVVFLLATQRIAEPDFKDTIPQKLLENLPGDPRELLREIVLLISEGIKRNDTNDYE